MLWNFIYLCGIELHSVMIIIIIIILMTNTLVSTTTPVRIQNACFNKANLQLKSTYQNRISENHKVDIHKDKLKTVQTDRQTDMDPK